VLAGFRYPGAGDNDEATHCRRCSLLRAALQQRPNRCRQEEQGWRGPSAEGGNIGRMSRRQALGAAGALIVAAATGVRRRPARAQSAAGHSKARKIVVGRRRCRAGGGDHPVHDRQRAPGSRSGTARLHSLLVQPEHLADRFKDAMLPPVFATPMMIMVMENAALNAIRAYLDPGEIQSARPSACVISRRRRLDAWLRGRLR
jgi:hypothetical protein